MNIWVITLLFLFLFPGLVDLNGRFFGGKVVKACFYNLDKFRRMDYSSPVEWNRLVDCVHCILNHFLPDKRPVDFVFQIIIFSVAAWKIMDFVSITCINVCQLYWVWHFSWLILTDSRLKCLDLGICFESGKFPQTSKSF